MDLKINIYSRLIVVTRMMKSRGYLLYFFTLFVTISSLQAKPFLARILLNQAVRQDNTPLRNVNSQSRNTLDFRQRNRNCFDIDTRNELCLFQGNKKQYGFPIEADDYDSNEDDTEFIDLTRFGTDLRGIQTAARSQDYNSFSEDYLDVNDLSVSRKVDNDYLLGNTRYPYTKVKLVVSKPAQLKHTTRNALIRKLFNASKTEKNVLRSRIISEESEEESSEESRERSRYKKPKRFEVVKNSKESSYEESREMTRDVRPARDHRNSGKVIYAQSPTRHLYVAGRRRLPHFLPKRYHWSEDDIQKLPYLWFNGPQGLYPGIYRISS
ncbi:uncharacterized protein [Battus philenor]|uniref:uncharacterized protein n=1 Tax=Battus philenor TaxID=42288 RepID=UPI0035CE956C